MFFYDVGHSLTVSAEKYPKKIALIFQEEKVSYAMLEQRVNRLANNLMELGIVKGDRVGYIFPNCIQLVELYFAIQKIGAVAVPMNHRLTYGELKILLETSECKALVYSSTYDGMVKKLKVDLHSIKIFIRAGDMGGTDYNFEQLRSQGDSNEPGIKIRPDDLSRIQHTGGTTGLPKGVMRTHEAELFQNVSNMIQSKVGASADEVIYNQSPMHHQGGMIWLLASVFTGATLVIGSSFEPHRILDGIESYRVTYLNILPPSAYLKLLEVPTIKSYDLSSVRMVNTGAGVSSEEIIHRIFDLFPNCEINYGWGQTETGVGTNNILSRSDVGKSKSVGRAAPFVELRIVDEQGHSVEVGEIGECIAGGPTIMAGYYKQPELTAAVYKDGWIYTGDMLSKDQDGFYHMAGRKKDMIKSGGENVFAREVEYVIRNHHAIQECAVIGVPDRYLGEAVAAIIKLRDGYVLTVKEVQEYCKERISSYKKPRFILFVDNFPLDDTGKVKKAKLREIYKEHKGDIRGAG